MARSSTAPALPVRLSLRHLRRVLRSAAVLLVAGGCASASSYTSSAHPRAQSLHLQVNNQNGSGMVIYAVQQGGRFRLGEVAARETRDFHLRIRLEAPTGALRLWAQPTGLGRGFLTTPVEAGPGDQVRLVLDSDSRHSQVLVYSGGSAGAGKVARMGPGGPSH